MHYEYMDNISNHSNHFNHFQHLLLLHYNDFQLVDY